MPFGSRSDSGLQEVICCLPPHFSFRFSQQALLFPVITFFICLVCFAGKYVLDPADAEHRAFEQAGILEKV